MNNPAFILAAYAQACDPERPIDIDAYAEQARICAGDAITGEVSDVDSFYISLWAHLARRGIFTFDFRLVGCQWEALLSRSGGWHRIQWLLDMSMMQPAALHTKKSISPAFDLPDEYLGGAACRA